LAEFPVTIVGSKADNTPALPNVSS